MKFFNLHTGLLIAAFSVSSAKGTLLFYEGFSDENYTEGAVLGQPLIGSGYLDGGSWNTNSTFENESLEYPGLATTPGFLLTRSNGEVIANLDTSAESPFGSAGFVGTDNIIGGAGITGSLYFSILARRDDTTEASFAGFQVYEGASEGFGPGEVGNPTNHTWFRAGANGVIGSGTPLLPAGNTNLYVFRLDFDEVATTDAQIWINPDITLTEDAQSVESSTIVTNAVTTPSGGFDNLRFRGTRVYSFDEIRIGTTWESVTPLENMTALAITSFEYSSADTSVTVTWNSRESETYIIRVSEDLESWDTDLEDGVTPDAGTSTTKTYNLTDSLGADLASAKTLFFRVEVE